MLMENEIVKKWNETYNEERAVKGAAEHNSETFCEICLPIPM